MAKYTITCSCGHEIVTNIAGKVADRESKAEYLAKGVCPECYAKAKNEEAKARTEQLKEQAKGMNLPELTGSEKQISWASSIRLQFVNTCEDLFSKAPNERKEQVRKVLDLYKSEMIQNTESRFWIDKRNGLSINDIAREASKFVNQ